MTDRTIESRADFTTGSVRASDDETPILSGHFSVFNQWTRIHERGQIFLERVAPGAFTKTFAENRAQIKVMFQHGQDPQIGEKPLGQLTELREGDEGAYYEAPLFDTSYNRDLLPALRAGAYGASFRFKAVREDYESAPQRGDHNPDALPERTLKEVRLYELGPVTWGAYPEATSGIRSLTDLYDDLDKLHAASPILLDEERLAEIQMFLRSAVPMPAATDVAPADPNDAPPPGNAAPEKAHLAVGRRGTRTASYHLKEQSPSWKLR